MTTPLRPQQSRIAWPLTPSQVESIDTMFETLFKRLRAIDIAASTSSADSGEFASETVGSVLGRLPINDSTEEDDSADGGFIPDILNSVNVGWTQGSVVFAGPSGKLAQNNIEFGWDDTNFRLQIGPIASGLVAPKDRLDIRGGIAKANEGFTQLMSMNSTDTSGPLGMIWGLRCTATVGNRYGWIEVDDNGTKRTLALCPFGGVVGIGVAPATALLHLAAGTATANTAPLKFTSGTLLTSAEAGAMEFVTDTLSFTITTGAARKTIAFTDSTMTGTWNGTKIGLLYGGTNADLSGTGGASKFLRQNSAGAAIDVVQPASTDMSDLTAWTNWTPTDQSGAGLSLTVTSAKYWQLGKLVVGRCDITYPTTADGSSAAISLPVTPLTSTRDGVTIGFDSVGTTISALIGTGGTILFVTFGGSTQTNANMSTAHLVLSFHYQAN